ncbi:MAG: hypothetical protein QW808_04055 [Desulfurococcaceae archaeon]
MVKVRKYITKNMHPLAPFTVEVEGLTVFEALEELKKALDIISKDATQQKTVAEKPKNPLHCQHVQDVQGILVCTAFPGEPKAWSRELVEKTAGANDPTCINCKKFKPR